MTLCFGFLAHRDRQRVEMRQKPGTRKSPGENVIKDIRRPTRKQCSDEATVRIVLDGLLGQRSGFQEFDHRSCNRGANFGKGFQARHG